jgi:RimJ/RimL family protein N-acetyltransferase
MLMDKSWIKHPVVLSGQLADLLPLEEKHFDELLEAASDKRIWEFYPGDWSEREKFFKIYSSAIKLREKEKQYTFVVFHKPHRRIIGSTMFLDIVPYDKRLEIGGTWLMPEYWAGPVNIDCKLALLTYCFETLKAHRVQLKTQHNNIRSWKAIEKIGGVYEGILREHMLRDDGSFRSSAYFSILEGEWAKVKKRLALLLESRIKAEAASDKKNL